MGVWVSARGLRRVGFFGTRTVPLGAGRGGTDGAAAGALAGAAAHASRGRRWLVGATGRRPLRPLLTDHNADFLARAEAFDRAADAIEALGGGAALTAFEAAGSRDRRGAGVQARPGRAWPRAGRWRAASPCGRAGCRGRRGRRRRGGTSCASRPGRPPSRPCGAGEDLVGGVPVDPAAGVRASSSTGRPPSASSSRGQRVGAADELGVLPEEPDADHRQDQHAPRRRRRSSGVPSGSAGRPRLPTRTK